MADRQSRFDSEVVEKQDQKVKEPDMYKVVLHNDDYTTKDFVVHVLRVIFHKPPIEATKIMLHVHKTGRGVVGVYTWDVAQSRASKVHQMAREYEFPLKCTVEEA
jgi:ATP-dependent Clp protease adaptor protein ClpS